MLVGIARNRSGVPKSRETREFAYPVYASDKDRLV